MLEVRDGRLAVVQAPALNALNEKLRDDYVKDAQAGIERWNKIVEKSGVAFRFRAPHKAFNRKIGPLAAVRVDPEGNVVSEADWATRHLAWLPSESDRAFVASLMGRVAEPGQVRELDRAAGARHQQPAGRVRVRPLQLKSRVRPYCRVRPLDSRPIVDEVG